MIHLCWNVISLTRGLVSLPLLNLLHPQNDLDNRKLLTYAVQVTQEQQKSKICEMKVEKNLNPAHNPKVFKYISTIYNLQVGFYKSLVFLLFSDAGAHYEKVEFFDPRETPYSQLILQHTSKVRASTNIRPVVLCKLLALQPTPKEISLPNTEGRNLVEVT